jgi:hypothetical protein
MSEQALPPARHETSDVHFPRAGLALAGTFAVLVLLALLSWWMFPEALRISMLPGSVPKWPAPEQQVSPRDDMTKFRAEQLKQLNSTWWVDRTRSIVHIPIDQAMQDVAREGIKDWPQ